MVMIYFFDRLLQNDYELRPLPEKRHYSDDIADENGNDMYMESWNDGINKLTGGTK